MRLLALCCCTLLLAPRAALTQQPPPKPPPTPRDTLFIIRLNTIVVTATRTGASLRENPAAVAVVDSAELATMPRAIAVDEAVKLVPGVKVDNQADGKRVHMSMRGQGILSERGIRGIKVLLDGLPINDPTGFAPDFYDVDWATVRQVEVQRGPAASLYGGGSSAGVVSITTDDGGPGPLGGMASATYGSNGFWRATGDVGGTRGDLNYRASYTHAEGDGYRVHTAFHGDNVYGKVHWAPSAKVRVTPMIWLTHFYNENPEGLSLAQVEQDPRQPNPDALTYNEYQDTKRITGGFVGTADLGHGQDLSFDGFLRGSRYRESVPSSVIHRSMWSPGATLQYTIHRSTGAVRHHVSVGTDVQWQHLDEYKRPNTGDAVEGSGIQSDQTYLQSGFGVFALDRLDLGRGWGTMLNVRYDRVGNRLADHLMRNGVDLSGDAAFDRVTGRVGVTYAPGATLSFYGNAGQGFLPPATEELANNPAQLGGFNQNLTAALSWGEEVGARGMLGGQLMFDVSLFHLHTDKDFDRYRVADRPLETFYRNAGTSRRFGAESYVGWAPVSPVLVQVAYTFSHFKYTNDTSAYGDIHGHWLPNSPMHQLYADGQVTIMPNLMVGVSGEILSKWYIDPSNATSQDGYVLMHARVAYRFNVGGSGLEATFAVRNIFDREYIAFTEPDPDGNSYQPAATREFFVGMRVTR
jgi:iron complex outermembrane receptor protein